MGHRAEIRFPPESIGEATDPASIIVSHHRVDRAELRAEFLSGGHLFHLALAGCVFNNIHRLAAERGIDISGARVIADGDFEEGASGGISCEIELEGDASPHDLRRLASDAYDDSSIAAVIRNGARVELADIRID